jgi:hypothetical protein
VLKRAMANGVAGQRWLCDLPEVVSTGLANLRDFESDEGTAFLEVARRCL